MSFQRNCERLKGELMETLCALNHDELVQYAREHIVCPEFMSTRLCHCDHASECWLLDLALETLRPAFLSAFIKAHPQLLAKNVFPIHCANWAASFADPTYVPAIEMATILRKTGIITARWFRQTRDLVECNRHCLYLHVGTRLLNLAGCGWLTQEFCCDWLGGACAAADKKAVQWMLDTTTRYDIPLDCEIVRTYLAQLYDSELEWQHLRLVDIFAKLSSGDLATLEKFVANHSHFAVQKWFSYTVATMDRKAIEEAVETYWLPALTLILRGRLQGPANSILSLVLTAGRIDLQRNSALGRTLYRIICDGSAGDKSFFVAALLDAGFDPDLCTAAPDKLLLFELVWHGYDISKDSAAWVSLAASDQYLHWLVRILQILALHKHDADVAFQLYRAFYKTFLGEMPLNTPQEPPRALASTYPAKVLELFERYPTNSFVALPPSLPTPSLEEARSRAFEMWRRIWRERCFQIATAFRSMRLPDECFHKIAKALAPAIICRYLPRYLPDRVFLAVRRRSQAKENEE